MKEFYLPVNDPSLSSCSLKTPIADIGLSLSVSSLPENVQDIGYFNNSS